MINPINALDGALMTGVNAGVHAYNWAFGGTKEDLANMIQVSIPLIRIVGGFADGVNSGRAGILFHGTIEGYLSYKAIESNKKQMELENRANKKQMLDPLVESVYKPINKMVAFGLSSGSLIYNSYALYIQGGHEDLGYHYSEMIASPLRGLGCLVICADNLPPKKNVFRRVYEKVSEWSKELSQTPAPLPA